MKIVFCHCVHSAVIPADVRDATLAAVSASEHDVISVPDLCGLAARRDPRLKEWAETEGLAIVACYPRTLLWLFDWAGVSLDPARVALHNMREQSGDAIIAALPGVAPSSAAPPAAPDAENEWVPWFPVIDRLRCKNCRQCLNFCPFGVYELDEERKVTVKHPANCKTNCPACARLCPEVAIVFPKYAQPPINGAEVRDADVEQRKAAALKERLKKQDIHAILAQRSACAAGCSACSEAPSGEASP